MCCILIDNAKAKSVKYSSTFCFCSSSARLALIEDWEANCFTEKQVIHKMQLQRAAAVSVFASSPVSECSNLLELQPFLFQLTVSAKYLPQQLPTDILHLLHGTVVVWKKKR